MLGDGGEEERERLRRPQRGPLSREAAACSLALRACSAKSSWTMALRCWSEARAARLQPDARCVGAQLGALPWHLAVAGEEMELEATALADHAMALQRGGQFLRLRPGSGLRVTRSAGVC